jgi:hypothetical protein
MRLPGGTTPPPPPTRIGAALAFGKPENRRLFAHEYD